MSEKAKKQVFPPRCLRRVSTHCKKLVVQHGLNTLAGHVPAPLTLVGVHDTRPPHT